MEKTKFAATETEGAGALHIGVGLRGEQLDARGREFAHDVICYIETKLRAENGGNETDPVCIGCFLGLLEGMKALATDNANMTIKEAAHLFDAIRDSAHDDCVDIANQIDYHREKGNKPAVDQLFKHHSGDQRRAEPMFTNQDDDPLEALLKRILGLDKEKVELSNGDQYVVNASSDIPEIQTHNNKVTAMLRESDGVYTQEIEDYAIAQGAVINQSPGIGKVGDIQIKWPKPKTDA